VIAFAEIVLGHGGLPECSRCHSDARPQMRDEADITAEIREAVEAWRADPGPNVALVGAESYLHPDLPSIVRAATSMGVRRLRLATAGEALAAGENAAGSLAAGVRQVEFVALAGDRAVHDALSGSGHSLTTALAGIARFRDAAREARAQVAVTGRVPVCDHNIDAVPSAVAAIGQAGGIAVVVDLAGLGGAAPGPEWLAAVADTGMVNRTWVTFTGADIDLPVHLLHTHRPSAVLASGS